MKRIISLILAVILVTGLCACGGKSSPKDTGTSETSNTPGETSSDKIGDTSSLSTGGDVSEPTAEKPKNKKALPDVDPLKGVTAAAAEKYTLEGKNYMKIYADNIGLIKYCGTWQALNNDPKTFVSYWNDAYAEIDFTGSEIIAEFDETSKSCLKYSVDGGSYKDLSNLTGNYKINAGSSGKHTLRIYHHNRQFNIFLKSFMIPDGETFSRTENKEHYIQFIGDSISDAAASFSHRVGPELSWDFACSAVGGMSLRTGYGYTTFTADGKLIGMEDAFFHLGYIRENMSGAEQLDYANNYFDENSPWANKFKTGYYPDIVFIFLGTNDGLTSESQKDGFISSYKNFVEKLLNLYGKNTKVFILHPLTLSPSDPEGWRYKIEDAAAEEIIKDYPENVTYIDGDTVKSWNIDISSDGTHPTTTGYDTMTVRISEYLKDIIG